MPMTNDDFCLGARSRGAPWAKCPFPESSMRAWSWWKGYLSAERVKPDGQVALQKLARDGVQGHNMKELAQDASRMGL